MSKDLGARLRAARMAIYPEVNQREVAKSLDVSPSSVNLWEHGKTEPNAETLATLARMYKVSTDWLLGTSDDKGQDARVSKPQAPLIFTVPVVPEALLRQWNLSIQTEQLQTAVLYPAGTAAGMVVSTDALTSTCPTGCYAVISKSHKVGVGNVVVAVVDRVSELVLRRLVRDGGDDLLIADDSRYPTYRLAGQTQIIGRVTEVTVRKSL